jgi:hypothetical protein
MATDFLGRCDAIEESYEFMLGYAGKGISAEPGNEIRRHLERAAAALDGMGAACREALRDAGPESLERSRNFVSVLDRDASDSLAAIEMVLGQAAISSQMIDNLNASIHLRALLTDLFLISDVISASTPVLPEKP